MAIITPTTRIENCAIHGKPCAVAQYSTHWAARPVKTCEDLGRIASEMLSPIARTCDQWEQWAETCRRYLWQIMWNTQAGRVDGALAPAMLKFVRKHYSDAAPQTLCLALAKHGPAPGDPVRLARLHKKAAANGSFPSARWVRCEKHGAWCAVGLSTNDVAATYEGAKRWIIATYLIASVSRSCDEFQARQKRASPHAMHGRGGEHLMNFSPINRRRWTRTAGAGDVSIDHRAAAAWESLTDALGPWETIATAWLSR